MAVMINFVSRLHCALLSANFCSYHEYSLKQPCFERGRAQSPVQGQVEMLKALEGSHPGGCQEGAMLNRAVPYD